MIKFPKAKSNQCILCFTTLGTSFQAKLNKHLIIRHRISPEIQCQLYFKKNIYVHREGNFSCKKCQPIIGSDICQIETTESDSTIQCYEKIKQILSQITTQIKQNFKKSNDNTFKGMHLEKLSDKKCKIYCGLSKDNISYLHSLTGIY